MMIDIDDSIAEVHGHGEQGSDYGYSGVGGLNSLVTTVTTGLNAVIRTAAGSIDDDAWTPIRCTNAVYDEEPERWISVVEVVEIPFTAFAP